MKKSHAIMIAQPYQGHINAFVHLAIKLASKGITVTFINTEYAHHHQISKSSSSSSTDIFSGPRASGLDIRYMTISDGFPLEFDRDLNLVDYWESLMNLFPVIALEFVGKLIESTDDQPFLIADTFGSWPSTVAHKYNLVNVSFWTMPSIVFALDYYKNLLVENGHFPPKDDDEHIITYIPGVESISTKNLTPHLQEAETTILHKFVFKAFEEVVKADFILHNTVQELEANTLINLKSETTNICNRAS